MEFFLPGLFLFLASMAITAFISPKMTPIIATVLGMVFLTYGVYHHQKLFSAEYRLSTWQDGLKIYAPAIMILAVLVFLFYAILSFFTAGRVPVPTLPNISLPSANSLTNTLTSSFESVTNSINNSLANSSLMNSLSLNQSPNQNQPNKNKSNVSRSFLETV